jgi:hypothetical protein
VFLKLSRRGLATLPTFHTKRLDEIEDRLARLDGGHDATEAKLSAYELVNASRRGTGTAPLGFKIT